MAILEHLGDLRVTGSLGLTKHANASAPDTNTALLQADTTGRVYALDNTGAILPLATASPSGLADAVPYSYWLSQPGMVHVATTANVATLAGGAPSTLDGVALGVNMRILVKDQTTTSQNGLYVVTTVGTGANGTWTRAADADSAFDFARQIIVVGQGSTQSGNVYRISTLPTTVGTDPVAYTLIDSGDVAIRPNLALSSAASLTTPSSGYLLQIAGATTAVAGFINTSGVPAPFQSGNAGFVPGMQVWGGSGGGWFEGYKSNSASPVVAGSDLASYSGGGYDSVPAIHFSLAKMLLQGDGTWSGSSQPTRIMFQATASSSTSPANVLEVYGTGQKVITTRSGRELSTDILFQSNATITTPSSATDQTILSQAIAGNTLSHDGDRLRITVWGDFLTNAAAVNFTPKIKWGATTLAATAVAETASANSRVVYIQFDVVRLSATTQRVNGIWMHSNKGTAGLAVLATSETWLLDGAAAETLSGSSTLQVVSNFDVANANNRMRSFGWHIELIKV